MQGKGKKLGKEERARRFTKWFWTILCIPVGIFLVLLVLTASGAFGRLPSFEELENPKSNLATEIYADDGRLLGSFFIQNRSYVDYEELSPASSPPRMPASTAIRASISFRSPVWR